MSLSGFALRYRVIVVTGVALLIVLSSFWSDPVGLQSKVNRVEAGSSIPRPFSCRCMRYFN